MIMPRRLRRVPFDGKEFTDALFGMHEEKFGSFVRNRDIRRQAFPWELDENIKKEPKDSLSFNNLKRIEL